MWFYNMFPFMTLDNKTSKKLAQYENNLEFQNTFYNLLNIAMYSFSFEGLPETCNERFFKMNLILRGCAAIINDPELGFLSLGITPMTTKPNIYGEWSEINAYGWNGFNKTYKNFIYGSGDYDVQSVVCKDNETLYPFMNYLIMYSKRMADCMRTLDITARKLKTPYFITCDESQKTNIKKILDDVDFNNDSIIANKSTMPNEFSVLDTKVKPESVVVLWQHYSNLESEIRTLLGINSAANLDKKERLVVDEANANDILTDINIDYRMKCYQQFCDTVNKVFGLNISVKSNIQKVEEKAEKDKNNAVIGNGGTEDEN